MQRMTYDSFKGRDGGIRQVIFLTFRREWASVVKELKVLKESRTSEKVKINHELQVIEQKWQENMSSVPPELDEEILRYKNGCVTDTQTNVFINGLTTSFGPAMPPSGVT
jgi:NAD-specific glutamate dehydrogenase